MANPNDPNQSEVDKTYESQGIGSKIKNASSMIPKGASNRMKQLAARFATKAISFVGLKVILIVLACLLLIMTLIGLISFVFLGPESIRANLVKMADNLWTDFKGIFVGQAEAKVTDAQIAEVAGYLDNMGYKLEGYGFGTAERDDNGKVTKVDSRYLAAYLAAENKTYMIANQNFNFKDFWDSVVETVSGDSKLADFLNDGEWGSGMIVLNNRLWSKVNEDNVEIDRPNQLMNIKMRDSENSKELTIYQYNLDGWMGRYGKPFEFLFALHVGTMAPDFAYQVAVNDEFDTKVFVKFHKVQRKVRLKYTHNSRTRYVISFKDDNGKEYKGWDQVLEEAKKRINAENENRRAYNSKYPQNKQPLLDVQKELLEKYGINDADIAKAKEYEKKNSKQIYKPYIRSVNKHWFRDLDFSDSYVVGNSSKKITGNYCGFMV